MGATRRSSKAIVFIAIMGALGNVLSFISIALSPLISSIPIGPINFSLALDLSHLATFIAALAGGTSVGGMTGLIGGLVAANQFGFSQGNIITGFALPLGKALTGLVAGFVIRALGMPEKRRALATLATVTSYVPEAAFTAALFVMVYPVVFGLPGWLANLLALQIVVKAFVEMVVMGVLLSILLGNRGFEAYVRGFFAR